MRYLRALRPVAGMDLHCPHRWEEWNDHVFIVKTGTEADRRIERFGQALSELSRGLDGARDIPYDPAYDIEGGDDWNQPYPTCSSFMIQENVPMAFSIEIPYFGLVGGQYTTNSLRRLRERMARALSIYIWANNEDKRGRSSSRNESNRSLIQLRPMTKLSLPRPAIIMKTLL